MKQCTCYALRAVDCTCKPAKYGELYTSPTAKQEQGEPVAWMNDEGDVVTDAKWAKEQRYFYHLYTTPQPAQKPLTSQKIIDIADKFDWDKDCAVRFARAIEAAHGIKE